MNIESGNTTETYVRLGIVTLACAALSCWFLRDGLIVYPHENAVRAGEQFPEPAEEPPTINPLITESSLDLVHKGDRLRKLTKNLGEPSYNNGMEVFWVGKMGFIHVKLNRSGLVQQSAWVTSEHPASDYLWQFVGAGLTALLALLGLAALIRATRTHVALDDRGLTCNRGETIEWGQMQSLDTSLYKRKGFVMLQYDRGGGGDEQKLHSFHIARFKDIVTEICKRKGFDIPFQQAEEGKSGGAPA